MSTKSPGNSVSTPARRRYSLRPQVENLLDIVDAQASIIESLALALTLPTTEEKRRQIAALARSPTERKETPAWKM